MATNGNFAQQDQLKLAAEQYPASVDSSASNSNLSKDEVGWYFVEQYYTTLSKSPEKLHLFYGKRSQFVHGKEAEVANVSVGRQAIQERIKELEFQDCKVRVSNVDAQATFDNIVIQVIGETSNKAGEPRKFVQTFVLAQQPSGYFVLNDMFRFIDEDDEEEAPVDAAAPETVEPAAEAVAAEPVAEPVPVAAPVAEEKTQAAEKPATNGNNAEAVTDAKIDAATEDTVKQVETEVAEEAVKQADKPTAPTQTPAPAAKVEATPAEPAAPPKPMTWASRAAAAAGPRPVVPLPKTATPPATNQSRAPAPATAPAAAPASAAPAVQAPATTTAAATDAPAKEASGWQTAGADSKRQSRPAASAAAEKEGTMGYVKYVTEKVQEADLRAALAAHGELSYFDINRQKNCAFVEYKTLEAYQVAISSNPHVVNGENIVVEPRRPKATGFNGGNFGAGRGNSSARGRGNYSGQSRGRGGAARGRGGAQANNA
ncbi:hypothetical protein K4F52_003013 [Lecanicillium sp. MT-2017a]|nr:hypothetical protein K4F52_003013 [Lecanicillium sp. MT-2017a]